MTCALLVSLFGGCALMLMAAIPGLWHSSAQHPTSRATRWASFAVGAVLLILSARRFV
jgi:uncharacterized membrane protein YdcZ (DUF606 family)